MAFAGATYQRNLQCVTAGLMVQQSPSRAGAFRTSIPLHKLHYQANQLFSRVTCDVQKPIRKILIQTGNTEIKELQLAKARRQNSWVQSCPFLNVIETIIPPKKSIHNFQGLLIPQENCDFCYFCVTSAKIDINFIARPVVQCTPMLMRKGLSFKENILG
jgi:hypothetical protein